MATILTIVLGTIALVLAGVAFWFANEALHASQRTERSIQSLQTRTLTAVKRREQEGQERPWRDSTPHDAPEWIRDSFGTIYELIQELQTETTQLKAEYQRTEKASAARAADSDSTTEAISSPTTTVRGRPVDLRDGAVVASRALAAPGVLAAKGSGEPALLYLNESVEIDHLALERWSVYFDFGHGEPYRRYRTVEPSKVEWNASAERGTLLTRGKAEAV